MRHLAIYASERPSNAVRKESLIFDGIQCALELVSEVERRRAGPAARASMTSKVGLRTIDPCEKIVALGRAAHTLLADYNKQTLVADDADLLDEDVERLIWSCVNTTKIIALGRSAWRSVQMLPIDQQRYYDLPPLRMTPVRDSGTDNDVGFDVLVINHENDGLRAEQAANALSRVGYNVQQTGHRSDGCGAVDDGWSASAPIHVHVGYHDRYANEVRLIDTWRSRRIAILLLPHNASHNPPDGALMVDTEVNGFRCDNISKMLAACEDVQSDPVLKKRMLHSGAAMTAPLEREWHSIAAELLSS